MPRAGRHQSRWNGAGAVDGEVPPGVYFVRLEAAGFALTRKAVVLR